MIVKRVIHVTIHYKTTVSLRHVGRDETEGRAQSRRQVEHRPVSR